MIKFSIKSLIEEDREPVKPRHKNSEANSVPGDVTAPETGTALPPLPQNQLANGLSLPLPIASAFGYNSLLARLQQQQQLNNGQKMLDWLLFQTYSNFTKVNDNIMLFNRLQQHQPYPFEKLSNRHT